MQYAGTIINRTYLSDHLIEATVALEDRNAYTYKAGQYADVALLGGEHKRLLSFTSAPHEEHVRFVIHISPSVFKQTLATAPLPLTISISETTGVFTMPRPSRPKTIVGIADNIGMTPFLSIARAIAHEPTPHTLVIINQSERALDGLAQRITEAGIPYTHLHPDDPLAPALTPYLAPHTSIVDRFYLSGKPSFVTDARQNLLAAGAASHIIIEEPFTGY